MIRPRLLPLLLVPVLFAACADEAPSLPDAAVSAPEAGVTPASVDGGAPTGPQGLAVVHTDYKTTLVSLVDPVTGTVTKDDCINSGSKPATLTATLSGDVVMPTQAQPAGDVVLIDRLNSTLTWVAPKTCEVTRQVNVGEGKMANPQDVLPVSAKKVYVPRYSGDTGDLLVLDPTTGMITGHIDLKPSTPPSAMAVLPNPARGLVLDGKAYVVLTALSADSKVGAPGRVVMVDPATDAVTGTIDLPALKNCASIAALPKALVVACGGVFGDPNQTGDSGVALVDLSVTPPAVKVVAAKDFGRALSPFDVAALSPSLAFVITGGDFSNTPPDQLWAFDFAGGAPRKVLDGKAAFTLSGLLADAARKKVYVADGDAMTPRLHVLDISNPAAITLQKSLTSNAGGLPPRYTAWY
jgi:hypothetical protein